MTSGVRTRSILATTYTSTRRPTRTTSAIQPRPVLIPTAARVTLDVSASLSLLPQRCRPRQHLRLSPPPLAFPSPSFPRVQNDPIGRPPSDPAERPQLSTEILSLGPRTGAKRPSQTVLQSDDGHQAGIVAQSRKSAANVRHYRISAFLPRKQLTKPRPTIWLPCRLHARVSNGDFDETCIQIFIVGVWPTSSQR